MSHRRKIWTCFAYCNIPRPAIGPGIEQAFFFFLESFIDFWLLWVFIAECGLSLVAVVARELLFVAACRLLIRPASLAADHRLQGMGSVAVAQRLSCCATCGMFWTRDQTCVPCIGR